MKTLLLVTETELNEIDVQNVLDVVASENPPSTHIELMVSYNLPESSLFKVLNSIALFRFNEAATELVGAEKGNETLKAEAQAIAQQAEAALVEKGFSVSTNLYSGQPYEGIKALIAQSDPGQAVFITRRYPVEDALNVSWTNHARDHLGIPVLHFHTASTRIED